MEQLREFLGWDHFLVRGKDKVSSENTLIMFTYNFKRVLNMIGIELLKRLIVAIENGDIEQIKQDIEKYILWFSLFLVYFFWDYFYEGKLSIKT